jgi:hypothetical protein
MKFVAYAAGVGRNRADSAAMEDKIFKESWPI